MSELHRSAEETDNTGATDGSTGASSTTKRMAEKMQPKDDADDPWTFFGSFSAQEIEAARGPLERAEIRYTVQEDEGFDAANPSGWSGPFCLWIHDEDAGRAQNLLVPLFRQ
ncbi:hypothetical protein ASA1KI_03810 [Opitutales bacterium ASA1]|uniref:hypothetical protein n=1 Tax=Congregicoccus parvus TaxID=3081749 RepID=UPI002B30C79A|nr:hypothetical protein ASA1KI_03810 [Opitutales bacterium ASA1]